MQYHTGLPTKTFNNCWQNFVVECRCVGFTCLTKFENFLPQKLENNVTNFQHYFEIKFLSSPKKMKNCITSHLFLDVWLQKLFSCFVSKNQKHLFIINLLTSLRQMKLFLRNNIAFTKEVCGRRVDFMHSILLATARLRWEADF